jgi:DNA polymerase I-like protein with 3'-5' exonuclease and polymerase domains
MKLAGCLIFEWILSANLLWKVKMCNSPHDEFVLEAPEELAEMTRQKVQEAMVTAGNFYLTNLTIKADAHVGDSWQSAKKPKPKEAPEECS